MFCSTVINAQTLEEIMKKATDPNANSKDIEKMLQNAANSRNKETGTGGYEKVEDDGFAHDLHKEYAGKLVFSDKEIGKATTSASNFKTVFNSLSGGIYGQVYLEKSLKNYRADNGVSHLGIGYDVEYFIDGTLVSTAQNNTEQKQDEQWTTWQVIPATATGDDYKNTNTTNFAEGLKNVKPGKHQVKVVLNAVYGNPEDLNTSLKIQIASGEFEFTFTEAEFNTFYEKNKLVYEIVKWSDSENSSANLGSSSNSSQPDISIKVKNSSGSNFMLSYDKCGTTSAPSTLSKGNERLISVPLGGKFYVNGKAYKTITESDKYKTIEVY